MLGGSAQLTRLGDIETMVAAGARGAPLRVIGTEQALGPVRVASSTRAPVRTAADLRGKTVGIPSQGGTSEWTLNLLLAGAGVDPATLEAATGLGMTRWQEFVKVRWPLALPVMIAGLRTATVTVISLATVAAWIGAGGLGTLLFEGITRNAPSRILAGTIAITALALLTDAILRFAESMTAIARARRAARS